MRMLAQDLPAARRATDRRRARCLAATSRARTTRSAYACAATTACRTTVDAGAASRGRCATVQRPAGRLLARPRARAVRRRPASLADPAEAGEACSRATSAPSARRARATSPPGRRRAERLRACLGATGDWSPTATSRASSCATCPARRCRRLDAVAGGCLPAWTSRSSPTPTASGSCRAELPPERLTLGGAPTVTVDGRVAARWTLERAGLGARGHHAARRDPPCGPAQLRAEAKRTARFASGGRRVEVVER